MVLPPAEGAVCGTEERKRLRRRKMEEVVSDSGGREREIDSILSLPFFSFRGCFPCYARRRSSANAIDLASWKRRGERERASQGRWASKKKPSIVDQGGRENRKKNRRTGTADMLSTLLGHCCLDGL